MHVHACVCTCALRVRATDQKQLCILILLHIQQTTQQIQSGTTRNMRVGEITTRLRGET